MVDPNPYESPEPPDARDERLVTIASFADPASANIARSVLDSEGIAACLGAETANTMLPYGTAMGGVKLMVFAEQADKAKAILAAHSAADFADSEVHDQQFDDEDDEGEDSIIERERDDQLRRAWYAAVLGLFLCPPLLSIYSMYLLLRHGLLVDEPEAKSDWRSTAALLVNLLALVLGIAFWSRGLWLANEY